jgi:hypothetical protein
MIRGRHAEVRTRNVWGRRVSAALVAVGLGTLTAGSVGLATANAEDPPGSGFGSIDIDASAYGIRIPFYSHFGQDVESELPYSLSQMGYGGSGHALTSVFWPGGTGGHGGDTLKLLAGSCAPPDPGGTVPIPVPVPVDVPCLTTVPELPGPVYEGLNDSYKAEAKSGSGDPTVTLSHPGVEMAATAQGPTIRATTVIAGAKLPVGEDTFGQSSTDTIIKLTGVATAEVDATSTMRDISLGAGAITIKSIKSVAHATTNGETATGTASTTVSGMEIAGVPVVVDDKGVHVQGQGSDSPSSAALNEALKQSGFAIYTTKPSKEISGATAKVSAGQLILMQKNADYMSSANDTGMLITLGGADISAGTSPAYVFDGGGYTPSPPPSADQPTIPPGSAGVTPGGVTLPPVGGDLPPPQVSTPTGDLPPVLAAQKSGLPGGISPGWVVAVLLGSGLIAAGLKRLPDQLFVDRGPACSLGGQS